MIRSKRNLINDIKTLKANHKSLKEFAKEKYIDENGIANIDIYVNSNPIFDKFSNPNKPELSLEFIQYIEKEAFYIPVEYQLQLNIHSDDNLDIDYISDKIQEHYWKELANKDVELKNNRIISIILLILGFIFLSLYFLFEFMEGTNIVFTEMFSITGSFAVWEAVDYALLNRGALRIQRLNIAQLALIKIKKKNEEE